MTGERGLKMKFYFPRGEIRIGDVGRNRLARKIA